MIVRPATLADAGSIQSIYGHHALHGFGTFEEAGPSLDDIAARIAAVLDQGLPYVVAELGGAVKAFAYAGPFRPRAAYRYTAEDSVYVAPDALGQGLGKAVLRQVIVDCEALGLRQLIAVIGDSGNAGSLALHHACGFVRTGLLEGVGYKHGRWVDVVFMQKALNQGVASAPQVPGLDLRGH